MSDIQNANLWARIKGVVDLSKSLNLRSIQIIDNLLKLLQENSEGAKHLNLRLEHLDIKMLAIGGHELQFETVDPKISNFHKTNEIIFTCLKIAIADQFCGFTTRRQQNQDYLKRLAFNEQGQKATGFWKLDLGDEKRNPPRRPSLARLWFLLGYLNTLKGCLPSKVSAIQVLGERSFEDFLSKSIYPELFQWPTIKETTEGRSRRLQFIRISSVCRLASRILGPGIKHKFQNVPNSRLFEEASLFTLLQELLNERSGQGAAIEVSLLLRTLGGKYVKESSSLEPWWKSTFLEGIKYVISKQYDDDGAWHIELPQDNPTPLLDKYSPLAHLLDLETSLLRQNLPELVVVAEKILGSHIKSLDTVEGIPHRIPNAPGSSFEEVAPAIDHLIKSVISVLSGTSTIYDRFKDLLSDSILNDFGAEEVNTDLNWSAVPKSLSFEKHLQEGVINRWVKQNRRRPGAILIFGPPGTGKTTVAELIVKKLNEEQADKSRDSKWRFLTLTPADFSRQGSQNIVATAEGVFRRLMHVRRCVVLLDEMEEFLRTRGAGSERESRLVTTAFLPLLQEAVKSRELILVVATNFVSTIDPAVTRRGRFDFILPLGPPDTDSRKKIIQENSKFLLIKNSLDSSNVSKVEPQALSFSKLCDLFASYTMGYSHSEIIDFIEDFFSSGNFQANASSEDSSMFHCSACLEIQLWKIRVKNIPTALSGRAGCNWKSFADETRRHTRGASEVKKAENFEEYWKEPEFPTLEKRSKHSCNKLEKSYHSRE